MERKLNGQFGNVEIFLKYIIYGHPRGIIRNKSEKCYIVFSKLIAIHYFKFLNVQLFLLCKLEESFPSVVNFTECRYSKK